jgi:hypothetical protein
MLAWHSQVLAAGDEQAELGTTLEKSHHQEARRRQDVLAVVENDQAGSGRQVIDKGLLERPPGLLMQT